MTKETENIAKNLLPIRAKFEEGTDSYHALTMAINYLIKTEPQELTTEDAVQMLKKSGWLDAHDDALLKGKLGFADAIHELMGDIGVKSVGIVINKGKTKWYDDY